VAEATEKWVDQIKNRKRDTTGSAAGVNEVQGLRHPMSIWFIHNSGQQIIAFSA